MTLCTGGLRGARDEPGKSRQDLTRHPRGSGFYPAGFLAKEDLSRSLCLKITLQQCGNGLIGVSKAEIRETS